MSASFHVLIFFEAKAGKADVLARILTDLTEPSRAEHGYKYYEPFADISDPNKFTVVEAWDSPEQWQAHLQTPHVTKALGEVQSDDVLTQPFTAQQLRRIR